MTARVLVVTAALLLLAGCAATPSAVSSTGSAAPIATPSPSPAAESLPEPTLPVTCADLFSDQEVSDLLGTAVTLTVDEATVRNISDAARLQVGTLSCIWGGESKTDNSWDQSLTVTVLPDAEADFDRGVWQVDDGAIVYPDGQLSEYLCNANSLNGCFANVLLDGYWAQARGTSPSLGEAQMPTIVDTLRSAITTAGSPREPWVAPAGALRGTFCGAPGQPDAMTQSHPDFVASARAGFVTCTADDGTWVTVLPGGAWALPTLDAYTDRPYWSVDPLEPITVAGTDAAIGAASVDDGYYLVVSVGGSAIALSREGVTPEEFLVQAPALIAEVVAAG